MATAAEITKLTEHAKRAGALLNRSASLVEKAGPVLDSYSKTLDAFEAGLARVDKDGAMLAAALAAMGNAGPEIDEAFRGDAKPDPKASGAQGDVSAKPSETAHVPETG